MTSYNYLAVDVLNIAYRLFSALPSDKKTLIKISNKIVYRDFVKDFISQIKYWRSRYLLEGGEIFLLFDNPTSRDDLKKMFYPLPASVSRKEKFPEYKANRKAASKEFYNSVDFIRWYYMMGDKSVSSCRINHVEADDLVKPFIDYSRKQKDDPRILLITNDSDWMRFIDDKVDYLPEIYEEPQTWKDFQQRKGYFPTEEKIILDKIINGDAADNITPAFPELTRTEKDFILKEFESINDLYSNLDKIPEDKVRVYIRDNERRAHVVYQMVALIPISDKHFEAVVVRGREASVYTQTIEKALGLTEKEEESSFTFSFLHHPRVDPKE